MEVDKLLHMNGVDHKTSYAEFSNIPKFALEASKPLIESSIKELISNTKQKLPKCINVADLGCSSGPNAFLVIQEVIKTCQEINQEPPAFQLFLNDLVGNDFNAVFKSLPGFYEQLKGINGGKSSCFVAAMPGSFYGRLFPEQSIHFIHSCFSLHWLSQVPTGLVSETGEQLNKKNICWARSTSPLSVHAAYSKQFRKDFTLFLELRNKEMADSGKLVLTFMWNNEEEDGADVLELIGMTIHDMVKEGLIENDKLETFNLPTYFPSTEEIQDAIETEGSFKVKHLNKMKMSFTKECMINGHMVNFKDDYIANSLRASCEPILASHFGVSIMDDLFFRIREKISELVDMDQGSINFVIISLVKEQNDCKRYHIESAFNQVPEDYELK